MELTKLSATFVTVVLILTQSAFAAPTFRNLPSTMSRTYATGRRCGSFCKFTFCDGARTLTLGKPDASLSAPLCKSGMRIGNIAEAGEALVKSCNRYIPISHFSPRGLRQLFAPSFFKFYTSQAPSARRGGRASGVGHQVPQQNQVRFIKHRCVALPIAEYQALDSAGNVVDNIRPKRTDTSACIAFVTR